MSDLSKDQYNMPLYKLKKDIPLAEAGTIFYYDEGQLKMAWTQDGNCQNNLCADTIIFHANAISDTEWFEQISEGGGLSCEESNIYEETDIELGGEKLYKRKKIEKEIENE